LEYLPRAQRDGGGREMDGGQWLLTGGGRERDVMRGSYHEEKGGRGREGKRGFKMLGFFSPLSCFVTLYFCLPE